VDVELWSIRMAAGVMASGGRDRVFSC
jgi:hypothetical protein